MSSAADPRDVERYRQGMTRRGDSPSPAEREREDILRTPMPDRADRYLATICRACGRDRHDGTACKPEPQVAQSKGKLNFPRMLRFLWPMRHSR